MAAVVPPAAGADPVVRWRPKLGPGGRGTASLCAPRRGSVLPAAAIAPQPPAAVEPTAGAPGAGADPGAGDPRRPPPRVCRHQRPPRPGPHPTLGPKSRARPNCPASPLAATPASACAAGRVAVAAGAGTDSGRLVGRSALPGYLP